MELSIDLEKLKRLNLAPTMYVILFGLYNEIDLHTIVNESTDINSCIKILERDGWLKITDSGYILRKPAIDLLKVHKEYLKVKEWIQEWRNLFPMGVKSGGRPVRGDSKSCLSKMTVFVKDEKIDKERIFEATKIYIDEKKKENYSFMICADYLISKDNVSLLRSLVEDLDSKQEFLDKQQDKLFEDF